MCAPEHLSARGGRGGRGTWMGRGWRASGRACVGLLHTYTRVATRQHTPPNSKSHTTGSSRHGHATRALRQRPTHAQQHTRRSSTSTRSHTGIESEPNALTLQEFSQTVPMLPRVNGAGHNLLSVRRRLTDRGVEALQHRNRGARRDRPDRVPNTAGVAILLTPPLGRRGSSPCRLNPGGKCMGH